jgi:hypothetical protein
VKTDAVDQLLDALEGAMTARARLFSARKSLAEARHDARGLPQAAIPDELIAPKEAAVNRAGSEYFESKLVLRAAFSDLFAEVSRVPT